MIRAAQVVREPRGINWQNGLASCKDVLASSGIRGLLLLLAVLALLGGGWYTHQKRTNYAHHTSKPRVVHQQSNLGDTTAPSTSPMTSVPAATPPDTSRSAPSTLGAQTIACNQAAELVAQATYHTTVTAENAYHSAQVQLLSTTHAVTALLQPLTGSDPMAKESGRHAAVLESAQVKLADSLTDAHC